MSSDFERLVARAMREPTDPGTPCPSAETLAAYIEGALRRDEHASVELHASKCQRCASHLAALVQLEDQLAADAPPARPWWRRRPWLVPAAAAVLAGVVWTSLPRERVAELTRAEAPPAASVAMDRVTAPPAQAPPVARSAPAEPAPTPARRDEGAAGNDFALRKERPAAAPLRSAAPASPAPAAAPVPPAAAAPADKLADSLASADTVSSAVARPQSKDDDAPKAKALDAGRADQPVADERKKLEESAATPLLAEKPRAAEPLEARKNAAGAPARHDAEVRRPGVAAEAVAPQAAGAVRQGFSAVHVPALVVSATDSKVAWRVTGERIERTTDGGATWQAERAPQLVAPVVGSAPSSDVCWLADAHGLLHRRDASGSWTRVAIPEGVTAAGILARSASEATLLASGGRRFTSKDGGATWIEVR